MLGHASVQPRALNYGVIVDLGNASGISVPASSQAIDRGPAGGSAVLLAADDEVLLDGCDAIVELDRVD